jgi:tetratricopeptide (TPR) repeat protein
MPKKFSAVHSLTRPSALDIFTDRENEQKTLRELLEFGPHQKERAVTVFYGVGGVGKSTLKLKLISLKAQFPQVVMTETDYDGPDYSPTTPFPQILAKLVKDLIDAGVPMPFSTVLLALCSVRAEKVNDSAFRESLLEHLTNAADVGVEILSDFPGLGSVIKAAKSLFEYHKSRELKAALVAEGLWPDDNNIKCRNIDLIERLTRAFYLDCDHWLKKNTAKKLLLIIDGFERIQSDVRKEDSQRFLHDTIGYLAERHDHLRFVIFGREKLRWDVLYNDDDWDQYWNQHLLSGLTDVDAAAFHRKVADWHEINGKGKTAKLITDHLPVLLDATRSGEGHLPFHLDLVLEMLTRTGSADRLGSTPAELQDRFFRTLEKPELRCLMLLALCNIFDSDVFNFLVEKRLIQFEKNTLCPTIIQDHSYFVPVAPNTWRFHNLFRKALVHLWDMPDESGALVPSLQDILSYYLAKRDSHESPEGALCRNLRGIEILIEFSFETKRLPQDECKRWFSECDSLSQLPTIFPKECAVLALRILETEPNIQHLPLEWLKSLHAELVSAGFSMEGVELGNKLSGILFEREDLRVPIVEGTCDLVHLSGGYRKSIQMREEFLKGLKPHSTFWSKMVLRIAHHQKFVYRLSVAHETLDLLDPSKLDGDLELERLFMLHGSLACLGSPTEENLNELIKIVEACRNSGVNTLVRALRRVSDLQIYFGKIELAKEALEEAEQCSANSRQSTYLLAARGVYHLRKGEADKALKYFSSCEEDARKRGIPGWVGHAQLGIAESLRCKKAPSEDISKHLELAGRAYCEADNQVWGLVHVAIAKHLAQLDPHGLTLTDARTKAESHGYQADLEFIDLLTEGHSQDTRTHHLLFP